MSGGPALDPPEQRTAPWPIIWMCVWAAAAAALTLSSLLPGIGPNQPIYQGMQGAATEAWWAWSETIETFKLPLWNPYTMGGVPMLPSSEFRPFYPPAWLGLFFAASEPAARNVDFALHLFLAAAFAAWSVRAARAPRPLAGFAGLFWMGLLAAAFGIGWIDLKTMDTLAYLAALPALAIAMTRAPRIRSVLSAGSVMGLLGLAGSLAVSALAFPLWFAALLFARRFDPGAAFAHPRSRFRAGALALVLAASLSAVSWAPALEYLALTVALEPTPPSPNPIYHSMHRATGDGHRRAYIDDPRGRALRGYADLYRALGPLHPNFIRLFAVHQIIVADRQRADELLPAEEFIVKLIDDGALSSQWDYTAKAPLPKRQVRHKLFVRDRAAMLRRIADPQFNVIESSTGLLSDLPAVPIALGPEARAERRLLHENMHLKIEPVEGDDALHDFHRPGRLGFKMRARLDGLVQFAEPDVPGWQVKIDGERIGPPNKKQPYGVGPPGEGFFLTVFFPSGTYEVILEYDPASYRLGMYLMLLGLASIGGAFGRRAGLRRSDRSLRALGERAPPPEPGRPPPRSRGRVIEIDD